MRTLVAQRGRYSACAPILLNVILRRRVNRGLRIDAVRIACSRVRSAYLCRATIVDVAVRCLDYVYYIYVCWVYRGFLLLTIVVWLFALSRDGPPK